jgi:hypothetical protein
MTKQTQETAKQYELRERRKQVAIMAAQGMTEIEIGQKLGVDNTTISKDIKELKLISQQFVYDITKSDFTYYYYQNLELVKLILRKQWEIINKDDGDIDENDLHKWRFLTEIISTVETLHGYYDKAKHMHRTPELAMYYTEDKLGLRPGTPIKHRRVTKEDEIDMLRDSEEEWQEILTEDTVKQDFKSVKEAQEELAEIKGLIERIKNETPDERRKRIKTEGYFA